MRQPVSVFISYASKDAAFLEALEGHLAPFKRDRIIDSWHVGRVAAGGQVQREVDERLRAAQIVLLLVSMDYLASDDLHEREVEVALTRMRAGKAQVIPVLVRACAWEHAAFAKLSPLPCDERPVASWSDHDEAWTKVARGIAAAVEELAGPPEQNVVEAPRPAYEDDASRALAERIEVAGAGLPRGGRSAPEVEAEIRALRLKMREGGRLRAGDALGGGRYLLIERIGDGGFASVWRAFDKERQELVAVKVMHADQARDVSRRERFFRGARWMAKLGHEAVVRLLDPGGEDDGFYFFVMELMAGGDLRQDVLGGLSKRWDNVVSLVLTVGDALAEAHAKGIVHRDVKPENILLDASGAPRLTDFDLVAAADSQVRTRTRGGMGSFLYMAPEQGRSAKDAGAQADVYGLGMTAIFCLYGGELPVGMIRQPERVIQELKCSPGLKRVLMRAIELSPQDRYADAGAFCDAVREAATSEAATSAPAPAVVTPPAISIYAPYGGLKSVLSSTKDVLIAEHLMNEFEPPAWRHWQQKHERIGWRWFMDKKRESFAFMGMFAGVNTIHDGVPDLYFFLELKRGTAAQKAFDDQGERTKQRVTGLSSTHAGVRWSYIPGGWESVRARKSLRDMSADGDVRAATIDFFRTCAKAMRECGLLDEYVLHARSW